MGLSNGKEKIIDNVVNQGKKILNDKPNLKNNILQKEIIKRENQMKNRENKLKFELNIFIYSNSPIDKGLKKSIENMVSSPSLMSIKNFIHLIATTGKKHCSKRKSQK